MNMVYIELKPNLSTCIETLSKREYERALNFLLKEKGMDEGLGEKLEMLRLFLESADFGHLRNQYEGYLMEGRKVTLLVYYEEGKVCHKLIVE